MSREQRPTLLLGAPKSRKSHCRRQGFLRELRRRYPKAAEACSTTYPGSSLSSTDQRRTGSDPHDQPHQVGSHDHPKPHKAHPRLHEPARDTRDVAFKLGIDVQKRWRSINGYAQLASICALFLHRDGRLTRLESQPVAPVETQAPDAHIHNTWSWLPAPVSYNAQNMNY